MSSDTINGVDIQTIAYEEYVKLISTVFQDFALFAFSIQDNITTGKEYNKKNIFIGNSCLTDLTASDLNEFLSEIFVNKTQWT